MPEASVLREARALLLLISCATLATIVAVAKLPIVDLSHTISSADATNDMLL